MLTPEGRAVLMDFGLAKVAGASRLTRTGATLGTAAYMAPEVLRGETSDTRSDIWSLGIVIYEMLAGHRPFRGEQTATLAYAIMNTEPEPLRAPELPHGSNGVVTRALMKDPARRYPGALELVADLLMIERDHQAAPAGRGRQTRPRHAWAAAALALGIVLLVIALGALDVGGVRHRLLGSRPGIHSIAVLPLTNLSGDANQEYFVDGMTEELINDLGRLNALRVISRTSSMTYKNATKPLKQIARELGVDAIIEGSLLRSGDHVRVMAQLIRTPEERQVWAESYERTTGEAVAIPGDMARAVADELNLGLTPEEQIRIATPRKVNAEAHDAYLRGRFFLNKQDEKLWRTALEYFQTATRIDPLYAPAWNGIAQAYSSLSNIYLPPPVAIPQAIAAAEEALRLDSTLAEAHATLGILLMVRDWDWKGQERECRRALELNPSSSEVHAAYAGLLQNTGRFDASIAEWKVAMKIDPLSLYLRVSGAWPYYLSGRYEEGIRAWREAELLDPNYAPTHYNLGMTYESMGRFPEAIAETQKAVAIADHPAPLALLCHVYAQAGRRADALRTLDELNQVATKRRVAAYWLAIAHAGLGDDDQAIRYLEKSCADREDDIPNLKVDPKFAMLRSDPRFQTLLRRIGIPDEPAR